MLRTAFVLAALALAPAALACGDGPCDKCPMEPRAAQLDDVDAAEGTKVALTIEGMHCGKCADKITAALKGIEGVTAVSVDHTTGEAQVAFDATATDVEALLGAVSGSGNFTATQQAADES